jgi:hypothetical protein
MKDSMGFSQALWEVSSLILMRPDLKSAKVVISKKSSVTATRHKKDKRTPLVTPTGQALCYVDGGTNPVQNYSITYVQQ